MSIFQDERHGKWTEFHLFRHLNENYFCLRMQSTRGSQNCMFPIICYYEPRYRIDVYHVD